MTDRPAERQIDRQAGKLTDGQKDRLLNRQTDIYTHTHCGAHLSNSDFEERVN